jgi:HIT domain
VASIRPHSEFGAFLNPEFPLRRLHGGVLVDPGEPARLCSSRRFGGAIDRAAALWALVERVRGLLNDRNPDGFNVGFNAGAAAGQTVFHAHNYVMPRYAGDVRDPRGGIRNAVIGHGHYNLPTP